MKFHLQLNAEKIKNMFSCLTNRMVDKLTK
jgi:hypothetical protein